eukprot:4211473-Amphidinium_carterae.1
MEFIPMCQTNSREDFVARCKGVGTGVESVELLNNNPGGSLPKHQSQTSNLCIGAITRSPPFETLLCALL